MWRWGASAPGTERRVNRAAQMQRYQWLLGLLATVLVALLWQGRTLEVFERITLDWRARWFDSQNPPPAREVAVVAIDDAALRNVGRWPWERSKLAAVIDELGLAGTSTLALDILLDDASADPREDEALAGAIRRHGSVVVAGGFRFRQARRSDRAEAKEAAEVAPSGEEEAPRGVTRERVFDFTIEEMVRVLTSEGLQDLPRDEALDRLKDRLGIARVLTRGPELDELGRRYDAGMVLLNQQRRSALMLQGGGGVGVRFASTIDPDPPVAVVANAAARLANVTFDSFDADGITRRVPLWVRFRDRLWPNLGLAAALQFTGRSIDDATLEGEQTVLRLGDAVRRLPTGRGAFETGTYDGIYYVTWPRGTLSKTVAAGDASAWEWQFYRPLEERRHRRAAEFPIGRVYEPVRLTTLVLDNIRYLDRAVQLGYFQEDYGFAPERRAEFAAGIAALLAGVPGTPEWTQGYEDVRRLHDALLLELRTNLSPTNEVPTAARLVEMLKAEGERTDDPSPEAVLERRKLLQTADAIDAAQRNLQEIDAGLRQVRAVRAELREALAGKLCFVGWTATGSVADFIPTSIHPKTPGVHVHAAVANAVLTGFSRRQAPFWLELVLLGVLGLLGTWIGVRASVLVGPAAVLISLALWFLVAGFYWWDQQWMLVSFSGPATATAGAWAVVMLHRLLVEQRSRKRTEERFKSRVAPALVDILVNNPDVDSMKPQTRELSVMFTDLAGFTSTAEKLGSARTAVVLAKHLGIMTEVVQKHRATLGKYIGDAIMAFWGAPIPSQTHAADACRAAVEMIRTLDRQNAAGEFGDAGTLVMRIGIASGEMMVGDFGNPPVNSDYTVIGDVVNLASRLEGANKAFGSRILVSERTRRQAGEGVRFRTIGRVIVKGKSEPILLYELVGDLQPKGAATDEWIALSDAAVEDYIAGRFEACLDKLRTLEVRFDDAAFARFYSEAVEKWMYEPVGVGAGEKQFNGSVQLLEK